MSTKNDFKIQGTYILQHFRDGKLLNEFKYNNGVVNAGLTLILDVNFRDAATKSTGWALGLINDPATLDATDTMPSHAGWTEFTSYSEATRPLWAPATAASNQISNAVGRDFNINASGTIHGSFCVDENTKGGATGNLWATAPLPAPLIVNNLDLIKLTYIVAGA